MLSSKCYCIWVRAPSALFLVTLVMCISNKKWNNRRSLRLMRNRRANTVHVQMVLMLISSSDGERTGDCNVTST